MSIKELNELLIMKNVPLDLYSLNGGLPNESYCIEKTDNKWHLYYSERGIKRTINYYDDEDEVVNAFLLEVAKVWTNSKDKGTELLSSRQGDGAFVLPHTPQHHHGARS